MNLSIDQLPNKRWGIYCGMNLLASIGSQKAASEILAQLQKNSQKWFLSKKIVALQKVAA